MRLLFLGPCFPWQPVLPLLGVLDYSHCVYPRTGAHLMYRFFLPLVHLFFLSGKEVGTSSERNSKLASQGRLHLELTGI